MSIATVPQPSAGLVSGRSYFLIRRLHSLTGIFFGGYLIVHLLVNATIAQGGNVYQAQVDKIHSLPFLEGIEWTFIFLPILFHLAYGVYMIATCQPNTTNYAYGKNVFYLFQRVTAVILMGFIAFHVLALKFHLFGEALSFDPEKALPTIGRHMHAAWWVAFIVYPIGIVSACFHLANGFWAAAITWGLTISKGAQRRWGFVCAGLFAVTLAAGLVSLAASLRLNP